MIPIALPADKRYEDRPGGPEDTEVGTKAAISHNQGEVALFAKKRDKRSKKKERDLQEKGTGDAIKIALPLDTVDKDRPGAQEDREVGSKAAISHNQGEA